MKDVKKEIRFLENRWILLKETSKVIKRKEGFLGNVLVPFMKFGSPLMKNGLTR